MTSHFTKVAWEKQISCEIDLPERGSQDSRLMLDAELASHASHLLDTFRTCDVLSIGRAWWRRGEDLFISLAVVSIFFLYMWAW